MYPSLMVLKGPGVEYAGTICLGYGVTDQTHLLAIVIRYVGAIVHKRRSRDIQQVIEGRLA